MRTSAVLQILFAGTALSVPHYEVGDRPARMKRAAAATTVVDASVAATGNALATVSLVVANALSGGTAKSHVHRRDADPAAPMPAEGIPAADRVVDRRATSVEASAGGFATASIVPNHVKVGAGGAGSGKVVQVSPRDIEAEEELPVPNRVQERQVKSLTLVLSAASTATASAAPLGVAAAGSGAAIGKSSTNGGPGKRAVEMPELEGVRRTASGALSMALMNDVDLDLYKETVDSMQGYADTLQEVARTYAEKAEAAGNLEAAVKAVDTQQLTTDLSVPLTQANDALYTGISRMMMSSARRPAAAVTGAWAMLSRPTTTARSFSSTLFKSLAWSLVCSQISNTGTSSEGLDIIAALLKGLLGGDGSSLLSGLGLLSSGNGVDGIINLVHSLMATTSGILPIEGVTTTLTPTIGL